MIKINIISSIFGSSGYDSHGRQLANALYKLADCRLTTQPPQDWLKHVNDAEMDMMTKPERKDDYNLIIAMPHQWKMFTGLGKNIGYCVFEGDSIPKSWIEEFENPKIDYIFIPSQHTYNAIMKTWHCFYNDEAIKEKLRIIPHGVDLSIFHSQQKSVVASADTFKFICNKGWRGTSWDRGGVQYLLKAFAEEFSKDEKVELILKLNPSYINPQMINQAITNLNLPKDRPQIKINCDNIPFDKLPKLYRQADCFVCATRAESFNLPGLEAMACRLPTIQTGFGGQTDYMNANNSFFINYDLDYSEEKPLYEEIKWAIPHISHLRKQMRWAFNNQKDIKKMGKQAEEDSKQWTWDISAQKIIKCLKN